jgi:Mg-chelatase subunit ChlI
MIMGDRGTGKSTTIRAIADLLPEIEVVKDDPFNSHKSDLDLWVMKLNQLSKTMNLLNGINQNSDD